MCKVHVAQSSPSGNARLAGLALMGATTAGSPFDGNHPCERIQSENRRGHAATSVPGVPKPQPCPPFSNTCNSDGTLCLRNASNITRLLPILAIGWSWAFARKAGGVACVTCNSTEYPCTASDCTDSSRNERVVSYGLLSEITG